MILPVIVFLVIVIVLLAQFSVYILKEYEKAVVFTLGRLSAVRGPGPVIIFPFIQSVVKIDQRTVTMDIPTQDVITKDNISIKVNGVLYYRVVEPDKAVNGVEEYEFATSQIAQTTLRSICGQFELDDLLTKREEINGKIQDIIDHHTDPWGIKVGLVEVKDIDLPQEMRRAMAKQAEAERERRAKVIQADGEFQAAAKLTDAANIMASQPQTIQLRYLETLRDIASENSSTIVFPLPIDFLSSLIKK